MTVSLSDFRQRERALDPAASCIVQAPAGSGKTGLLVRRYLTLLAHVEQPEEILAITFTRKATQEMRQRIVAALEAARPGKPPGNDAELAALAARVLENDARHGWGLTADTARMKILTIDALCAEIVRRMPWSARFGSFPEIIENPVPLYEIAAENALRQMENDTPWSDAGADLLRLVNADLGRSIELLAAMLKSRDRWMRTLGSPLEADAAADSRVRIDTMWQQQVEYEMRGALGSLPDPLKVDLWALGQFATEQLRQSGKNPEIEPFGRGERFPEPEADQIDRWNALACLLLTRQDGLRKQVNVGVGFPPEPAETKRRMVELLEELGAHPGFLAALARVRLLHPGRLDDSQWRALGALLQMLPVAAAQLHLVFQEKNCADYIEMTQRAAGALGTPDEPTDLALALDYGIRHILVDEFQDTSVSHLELLISLTSGWQADDGRSLFLVGDPMQSIYRFREAEVANFLGVQQEGLGALPVRSLSLESNFRSAPQLVDWFNGAFSLAFPQANDLGLGAVSYSPATSPASQQDSGEVHVHAALERDHREEACQVVDIIRASQREDPDRQIAVLGRARSHLAMIAQELRVAGIAFRGVELERLVDRPAIRDLVELTLAIEDPTDRIAWLSVLRAPWCGLGLDDLTALCGSDRSRMLVDFTDAPSAVDSLSAEGADRLTRVLNVLNDAWRRHGRIDRRTNLEATWLTLGGPATMGADDLDDCQRFFNLVETLETSTLRLDRQALGTALEDLWSGGGAAAPVQLLTVHKAKGLEFDTVVLPGLHRQPNRPDRELLRWRRLPDRILFAPLPADGSSEDPFYDYLGRLEKIHQHNETCRLLYVACTRAQRRLHLLGSLREAKDGAAKPPAGSLLHLLWPAVEPDFQGLEKTKEDGVEASATLPNSNILRRLPGDWRLPTWPDAVRFEYPAAPPREDIEFSWAGEVARIAGTVIHEILYRAGQGIWADWKSTAVTPGERDRWQTRIAECGLAGADADSAMEIVEQAVDNIRADHRADWIFSPGHRDIRAEWALTGLFENQIVRVVLDRSFVDEHGVRWIVDFKSSRHQGTDLDEFLERELDRHAGQMNRYAEVLSRLDDRPIRKGLYLPLHRRWLEYPD